MAIFSHFSLFVTDFCPLKREIDKRIEQSEINRWIFLGLCCDCNKIMNLLTHQVHLTCRSNTIHWLVQMITILCVLCFLFPLVIAFLLMWLFWVFPLFSYVVSSFSWSLIRFEWTFGFKGFFSSFYLHKLWLMRNIPLFPWISPHPLLFELFFQQ